jgi:hypothetical protein
MLEGWIKGSKDPRLSFVNVFNAMVDASGAPRTELFGPDKLHMTREGYKLWIGKVGGLIGATPTAIADKAMPTGMPTK